MPPYRAESASKFETLTERAILTHMYSKLKVVIGFQSLTYTAICS